MNHLRAAAFRVIDSLTENRKAKRNDKIITALKQFNAELITFKELPIFARRLLVISLDCEAERHSMLATQIMHTANSIRSL